MLDGERVRKSGGGLSLRKQICMSEKASNKIWEKSA